MHSSLTAVLVFIGVLFLVVYFSVLIHDRMKKKKHE